MNTQSIESLPEFASKLAALYSERAATSIANKPRAQALDERKFQLVPVDPETGFRKWPGKNEGERGIAERLAYAADPVVKELTAQMNEAEAQMLRVEGEIEAFEALRRAGEHLIYALMADPLSGLRSRSNAPAFGQMAVKDAAKYAAAEAMAEEIVSEADKLQQIVNDGAGEQVEMTPGEQISYELYAEESAKEKAEQPAIDLSQVEEIPF